MRVEIDVFSGRVNPQWELTPREEGELLNRFLNLPPYARAPPQLPDLLGYRGIRLSGAGLVEGCDQIMVSRGVILGQRGGADVQAFEDKDRLLERWLLYTGKSHIEPDLFREIEVVLLAQ